MLGKISPFVFSFTVIIVCVNSAVLSNWTHVQVEKDAEKVTDTEINRKSINQIHQSTVIDQSKEATPSGDNGLLCWDTPIDQNCSVCNDSEVGCFFKGILRYLIIAVFIIAAVALPLFCCWFHKSLCSVRKESTDAFLREFGKIEYTKVRKPRPV